MPLRIGVKEVQRERLGGVDTLSVQVIVPFEVDENGTVAPPSMSLIDGIIGAPMPSPRGALVYTHWYDPRSGSGSIEIAVTDTPAWRSFLTSFEALENDQADILDRFNLAKMGEREKHRQEARDAGLPVPTALLL